MKKTQPPSTSTSKNQMTLGQFWSSTGAKATKPSTTHAPVPQEEDDDIELLAAMEQFEKKNTFPSSSSSTKAITTAPKPASKWPISYKDAQDPKQNDQASISAPKNTNDELMQTYPDFDRDSGRIWIYPTNYEKRPYQYKIVSAALFQNTLVVLPTGLGKTFIAAVVMFNYCRWYPTGKIIFTAPTKPLVAQQMDACAKVMGIRKSEMCEMTGGVNPEERRRLWLEKRVFFLTPQTLNNDLVKSTCPWSKIRCLIIDEAHRALGQHAYCQVVQELCKNGEQFRILGLSATPGNNVEAVQNVIRSLRISHIEMFTDDSPEIKKFSFDKIIDKIVVGPNELMQNVRRCLLNILKQPVEVLAKLGVIYQKNPEHVTCGSMIMTMKRVSKDKPANLNDKQYQEAKNAMFFSISFYHALDELEKHGLQSVYNFFKKKLTEDKKNGLLQATFRNNTELNQIFTQLQNLFDLSQVSTEQRRITSVQVAHPKLAKLRECVLDHFRTFERTKTKPTDQTRVIIFSEKRDSVREITDLLEQDKPLVKPMMFIGQASSHAAGQGINQKLQKKVVTDFRLGGYNVLVSTSIGEEGLDIGSVDLIICFDALKSPIRLVQRMGRTGRARQGRIVLLMTEGKEERTFHEGEIQQKRICKLIVDGARMLDLYTSNLRMVPHDIQPVCQEMMVKMVDEPDEPEKQTRKKLAAQEADFSSILNKTKQQEAVLKLFRKEKLLNDNEFYHWVRNYQLNENDDEDNDNEGDGLATSAKDRLKSLIKTATEKWSNEQQAIQSPSMHSSRTPIFVDFMKNYISERVFVNIPDNVWPMEDAPPAYHESRPTELNVSNRPTMPSPFDRAALHEQIKIKRACSPVDLVKLAGECDQLLNLPSIEQARNDVHDEEIDCGDLFGTGSAFNITCSHPESPAPATSSPTQPSTMRDNDNQIGNFDVTMDDFFSASQAAQLSPTLQLTDTASQAKSVFDDDGMDDDELLQAFNQHLEAPSAANPETFISPVLILSNRVDTQHQVQVDAADMALPKFDLEFSFDDLEGSDPAVNNALDTSLSDNVNANNATTLSDNFETPIRPVRSKKRVRHLSAITPDVMSERKKSKSAQELGLEQHQRHFHRRLASDFLEREAAVDDTPSTAVSSDEDEGADDDHNDHDLFIDDRQVLTQMANIDMTSVYLKSIKSPKIHSRPRPPAIPIEDIYSQLPHMTMHDDTFEEDDSFVDDTAQTIDEHPGEVDFDELADILGTQSAMHRPSKVTRRGVRFGRTSATTTPQRPPATRRVRIAESPN